MVREIVGLDEILSPYQKRVARERRPRLVKMQYCRTCRRYSWMELTGKQWVCRECGCPKEK